ncbi:PAS domain S-box protein [Natronomonas salina]|uniref:receiver/sensor box histidine kinase n=1 Tax=Natronomonas salina TaxID=1710540 RepID=UPI0015B4E90F|nr:PAS domain S-box protein [Natronomonas salina]QLD88174.1 PAS domain S-box protein [Natronomonas salina]
MGREPFVASVDAALADESDVEVVGRSSIEGARSALAADAFDCVVSDATLPDGEGVAVVDALRETAPAIPFVLAPESGSEALAVRALRTDGVEYVPSTAEDRFEQVAARVAEILADRETGGDVQLRSFKHAVEQAGHSIYITDTDGTILYVNPAFEATTGYTAEQAIGRTPRILKSGEHGPAFYENLWETILAGDVWQSELVNHRADGSRYVVNQTIAPIVVDGRIERFVAVNADITDRIRREERLETLHDATRAWLEDDTTGGVAERACDQLAALFDAETVCICCHDDEGELVPAARSGPDAEGEAASLEACDCPVEAVEAAETRPIEEPDGQTGSELLLSAGDYGVARLTSPEPDAFDDTDLAIGRVFTANLEAVLESVENYRDLERQNERLDEFAGIVSHDLQNPLSVAMGFLDLLENRIGEDDDLERVRESLDHMDEIITDVLWLASEGDQVGELEPVSLERSAERSWSLVETGGATLAVDGELRFEADPEHVHRLLENLFANAVEHGGSDVTVRVGPLEDGSGFYVADDGPGVPPERHDSIFDVGHTTSDEGTGFGLAIVERIAEGHGWAVDVEESDAGGARFVVRT